MDPNVQKLLENEQFLEGLVNAETPEELGVVFKENNIVLAEGETLEDAFAAAQAAKTDELNEDSLEEVSGGVVLALTTAACFVVGSGLVSFFASYGYRSIKKGSKKK